MRPLLFACCALLLLTTSAFAESITGPLPEPVRSGGMPVLDAVETRHSSIGRDFFSGSMNMEQLSTLLWAAAGRNRGNTGWTAPTYRGKDPYVAVYVLADNGVFLYNGEQHSLTRISDDGTAKSRIPVQEFAQHAPFTLAFVREGNALEGFTPLHLADSYAYTLVGAMTQNLLLAAPAVNAGARYLVAFDDPALRDALKLNSHDSPVCLMVLTGTTP